LTKSKAPQPQTKYQLAFKAAALAEWRALDGSVKGLFRSALKKRLSNPRVPGSLLKGDLKDCYKIKLAKAGYRLVYSVQDDRLIVLVLSVGKREDSQAYREAIGRLQSTGTKPEGKT
jgi:mRNA interferase RelE/StbE